MKHRASNHCNNTKSKQSFDQLFNDFFGGLDIVFGKDMPNVSTRMARANILEDETTFHIELAAPGRSKKDFSIKLDGDKLHITATAKENTEDETGKYRRREFRHGSLKREFSLPKHIDREAIAAKYENGILLISIPKTVKEDTTKEINVL